LCGGCLVWFGCCCFCFCCCFLFVVWGGFVVGGVFFVFVWCVWWVFGFVVGCLVVLGWFGCWGWLVGGFVWVCFCCSGLWCLLAGWGCCLVAVGWGEGVGGGVVFVLGWGLVWVLFGVWLVGLVLFLVFVFLVCYLLVFRVFWMRLWCLI
ncbi:hypothetical protein RA267_27695, partial [Pseudomonas syringae pv. tagetis]|uniref:hypothetical protein n=1 Tax=Pseudomonas syringae group genomosp. 7 TaxID=251699 RepID=UPI00376FFA37